MRIRDSLYFITFFLIGISFAQPINPNQPPFLQQGPGATTDLKELFKFHLPFFAAPVVLGIVAVVVLSVLGFIRCCCCCNKCKGPLCLGNRCGLYILFSVGFALILGGSFAAWTAAPLVEKGINNIFDSGDNATSDFSRFVNKTSQILSETFDRLKEASRPFVNGTILEGLESLGNALEFETQECRNKSAEIGEVFSQMGQDISDVLGNLTIIQNLEDSVSDTIPDIDLPSGDDINNLLLNNIPFYDSLLNTFDTVKDETSGFKEKIRSILNTSISDILPLDVFENFKLPFEFDPSEIELPFNISSIEDFFAAFKPELFNSSFTIDDISDTLNRTIGISLPLKQSTIDELVNQVDKDGGIYFWAVFVGLLIIVIGFALFYIGMIPKVSGKCCNCLVHFPWTITAILIFWMGLAIGIHLVLGTGANTFCDNHVEYLKKGGDFLSSKLEAANLTGFAYNFTQLVLDEPERILECEGNQTIFELYDSDPGDFGIIDIINTLFNAIDFIPDFAGKKIDKVMNFFNSNLTALKSLPDLIEEKIQEAKDKLAFLKIQIDNATASGANDTALYEINNTIAELSVLYDRLNESAHSLPEKFDALFNCSDLLVTLRYDLLDGLFDSITLPDFSRTGLINFMNETLSDLGNCGWVKPAYERIVKLALCEQISPGLLRVGWALVAVALAMLATVLLVVWWALNFVENQD